MHFFWTPLRVGLVVAAAAGAFGLGLYLIGADHFGRSANYKVYAVFDDATGLGPRSRAQIAGIPIGQVDHVELDQNTSRARVWINVKRGFKLHRDASVTKRSESILGDYLLDVNPGSPDQPVLNDGDEIRLVVRAPSMNDVFKSLSRIADDIQDITGNLRKVLGGAEGEDSIRSIIASLQRITRGLEHTIDVSGAKLDATLANFQRFSGDLAAISHDESGDIVAILKNTRDATAEARDILRTIGDAVGSSQSQDLRKSVSSVKSTLEKLDKTLANVQEITDKVNKGEGTIGHLVNDDRLAKNLDKASQQITNILGTPDSLKIEVSERSEFLVGVLNPKLSNGQPNSPLERTAYSPWTKNYFGLRIVPRPDKWYGIELVDDPRGLTRRVQIQNDPATPPNFPSNVYQTTTERQLKFSVYMAKRYGPISGRFGLLENTGGFGLKAHLLNDGLVLSADAFEFANPLKDHPRVKLYADYHFLNHLLITAGVDDIANKVQYDSLQPSRIISGRDFFVGAGVYFTDDDIKLLISALPLRF